MCTRIDFLIPLAFIIVSGQLRASASPHHAHAFVCVEHANVSVFRVPCRRGGRGRRLRTVTPISITAFGQRIGTENLEHQKRKHVV